MLNALAGHPHNANPNQQAMMDWRQQRPDHTQGMDHSVWHQQIQDWRALNPHHQNALMPPQPGNPGIVPPQQPQLPQVMPGQMPINPGVGQSYAVQGFSPATSGFGLPTY